MFVAKSSAIPFAIFAIKFAVQGITRIASTSFASLIWFISFSCESVKRFENIFFPKRLSNVIVFTNSFALSVKIQLMSASLS